jgi:hypothetical protein
MRNVRDLSAEQIEDLLIAQMDLFTEGLAAEHELPILLVSFQPSSGAFASRVSDTAPPAEIIVEVLVGLVARLNQALAMQARN